VGRYLDAGREGCVLRLNRRLRCTALANMGGHELRVYPCSIDDGEAGNEDRKHETPYPGRAAPSAGEPSGCHELGPLHSDRHADH
jgi:hypothetical protein